MKSFTLFDYQEELLTDTRKSFGRKNKRVIVQLPTGGGKGVVLAEMAKRAIESGNTPCISCHRVEIFDQLYNNLKSFGIQPSLIAAGTHPMPGAPCYLSMVETLCRRMNKGLIDKLNINFFILDEVHFGSYYKLVNQLDCCIAGFTASPKSTGKPELNTYFDDIVCGPKVSELIRIGRLTPGVTFSVDHDFSKIKMKGGEYDDKALFQEFKKPKLWNGAVERYLEHAKGLQALCYSVNVEQSNARALQFREHGIRSAHVDGTTDQDTRKRIFDMYRNGEIDIICNVGIATTGTDLPETECIIQDFATTSLVKHHQTLGRGARAASGKTRFIIIDMGRNYLRHGLFGEDVNWEHIFNNPSLATKKESKREKRECDECGFVMKLTLRKCPNCGDFISQKEIEKKLLFGASLSEIKEYRLKQLPPHLRKPVSEMTYHDLMQYAGHMGHKPSWVHVVMKYRKGRK